MNFAVLNFVVVSDVLSDDLWICFAMKCSLAIYSSRDVLEKSLISVQPTNFKCMIQMIMLGSLQIQSNMTLLTTIVGINGKPRKQIEMVTSSYMA